MDALIAGVDADGCNETSLFYAGSFVMNARRYFLLVVLLGFFAFGLGYAFVEYLRYLCRTTKKIYRLSAIVFFTPFTIFVALNLLLLLGFAERMLCDALSFGIVVGVLFRLSNKPTGPNSIKLVVQEVNGRTVDVWLDHLDVAVGDVRNKIAETLSVAPFSRVAIESGKGNLIENLVKPFDSFLDDSMKKTDFFGFVTIKCFILVREEEVKKKLAIDENAGERGLEKRGSMGGHFFNILHKSEVKYGDSLTLVAKIAAAADFKSNFQVAAINKFAAAAPTTLTQQIQLLPSATLKLHAWVGEYENGSNHLHDMHSDEGDNISNTSSRNSRHAVKNSPFIRFRRRSNGGSEAGKPVRHGDFIVLESGGK
jgi:hypothetical protein